MSEIIWDKEKGFDFTETITPEVIQTPTYDYWNSQNTLDYNVALRNKPSVSWWVWNNWAYSFVIANWSATNVTTTLPLKWWFNWWWVVLNDTANNWIKVTEAWLYYITAQASFWLTNWARIYTRIRVNWKWIWLSQYYRYPSTTTIYYYPIHISGVWHLNAWDVVTFVWYSDWTLDWSQQDVSNWVTWSWHNEQWVMMQVYKL